MMSSPAQVELMQRELQDLQPVLARTAEEVGVPACWHC
jgi:hypothetical protein